MVYWLTETDTGPAEKDLIAREPSMGRIDLADACLPQSITNGFYRQSEVDRTLLFLHLDGNSHSEIGEVLGISESNVGTRLSRLKKTLRQSVVAHEN